MTATTRSAPDALDRLDDERLARLSGADRAGAFAALYARHHQALYRYCAMIVRNDADAQDALQATWLRALLALRRGQRDAPLRPWLFRIAHNESISILRRRARGREPMLVPTATPNSAEEGVLARERFAQLVDDLRALPERARSALVLRELTGLSHEEIATALDITVAAARQSIYEARRGLEDEAHGRTMACGEVQLRLGDGDRRVLRGRVVRAHIRHCPACAAFAHASGERRAAFGAFAPTLGVAASGTILGRVLGATGGGAGGPAALGTSAGGGAATGGASAGGAVTSGVGAGGAVTGGVGASGGVTGGVGAGGGVTGGVGAGGGVTGGVGAGGGVATVVGGATGTATKAFGAGLLAKSLAAAAVAVSAAGITVAVSTSRPHAHQARGQVPHRHGSSATAHTAHLARGVSAVAHASHGKSALAHASHVKSALAHASHVHAAVAHARHGQAGVAHAVHGQAAVAHAAHGPAAVAHAVRAARRRSAAPHAGHASRPRALTTRAAQAARPRAAATHAPRAAHRRASPVRSGRGRSAATYARLARGGSSARHGNPSSARAAR